MSSSSAEAHRCPDATHERRLVAVHLEDGVSVRELACQRCGAVWFS